MATPVGHILAGVAAGTASTGGATILGPVKDLVFFSVVAILPDLDFVPGLLMGQGNAFHQGPTHSLLAAALVALACWIYGRFKGHAWLLAWAGAAVYLSHLAVDWMAMDYRAPIGIPLFWPFSYEHMSADHAIFLDIKRSALTWAVIKHDLLAVAWEILLLGPFAAAAYWLRARRRRDQAKVVI